MKNTVDKSLPVYNAVQPLSETAVLPIFPIASLPRPVADMCRAVSEAMQTPLELPATVALGILAACCQKKAVLRVGADYVEPLNLYTLSIASSGERKSPVFRALTAPVYETQDEFAVKYADDISKSYREYSLLKKQYDEYEQKYLKGKDADLNELTRLMDDTDYKIRNYSLIRAPKLLIDDATSEKLIDIMQEQGGSVSIASAEGGIFINLKNKANMAQSFDVYLKAYSGDGIDVTRIGREGNSIKSPRLSLILTCQTDIAKNMINNPVFREKGLPARFLFALCRSNLGKREVETPDIPGDIKSAYSELLKKLLIPSLNADEPEREITLAADGQAAYYDYGRKTETYLSVGGRFEYISDWGAKLTGQMLRIAGLIAVCEDKNAVDGATIKRAAEIAEWYACNTELLFLSKTSRAVEDAKYLWERLKSKGETALKRSEITRLTQNKQRFSLNLALAELEERGYISIKHELHANADKPAQMIYINPLAPR